MFLGSRVVHVQPSALQTMLEYVTDKQPGGPLSDEVKFVSVGSVTSTYTVLFLFHHLQLNGEMTFPGRKTLTTRFNTLPSLSLRSPNPRHLFESPQQDPTSSTSSFKRCVTDPSSSNQLSPAASKIMTDHDREVCSLIEVVHIWMIEPGATCADYL